jgi:hypothetical protein
MQYRLAAVNTCGLLSRMSEPSNPYPDRLLNPAIMATSRRGLSELLNLP